MFFPSRFNKQQCLNVEYKMFSHDKAFIFNFHVLLLSKHYNPAFCICFTSSLEILRKNEFAMWFFDFSDQQGCYEYYSNAVLLPCTSFDLIPHLILLPFFQFVFWRLASVICFWMLYSYYGLVLALLTIFSKKENYMHWFWSLHPLMCHLTP